MTDKPKNVNISKLAAMKEDLIFLPNPAHRRAKSKFWARYTAIVNSKPSMLEVRQLTGEPAIARWWNSPGFKEWFFNEDEARERLEYLYMVALDAAESVLLNPEANDNAKVQMVKVIAQLAGKEPAKNQEYADADIQKMDTAKLKAYIMKNAPKLLNPKDSDGDE